ncbi:MAG: hypothetical protein PF961_23865 [Planctomycetota bacterium]|jgi:hypothetical protein|nr:hypothetical protein [Planctomycetota bacterium]
MKCLRLAATLALCISLLGAMELSPGAQFDIALPELGATSDGGTGRVGISLPKDYDAERLFPVICWFGGGEGGADPKPMTQMINNTGYIVFALPYQKGKLWGSPLSWYMPMIEAGLAAVPNANRHVMVAAGFSSGGGATGVVCFNKAGMDLFCGMIPSGLAPDFIEVKHPRFQGFPVLAIIGEKDTQHDRLGQMHTFRDLAQRAGLDLTYVEMKGVGHKLDKQCWPQVQEFLANKIAAPNAARFAAMMDQAAKKNRWDAALPAARAVLGLSPSDSPEAQRANECLAAASQAATDALSELGDKEDPKKLYALTQQFAGTKGGAEAQQRYDALAAASEAPTQPEALAKARDVSTWLKSIGKFVKKWPGSATSIELMASVDPYLKQRLDAIAAIDDPKLRKKELISFAKQFKDRAIAHDAVALLKAPN